MVDVNARRTLCTLVAAAFVDGQFDKSEKEIVYRKGREMGFSIEAIDEIVSLGKKGALAVSIPPTQKLKEDLLNDLIDIACADGKLEPAENHLLMKFASQVGMTVGDLGNRVRLRMNQRRGAPPPPPEVKPAPSPRPAKKAPEPKFETPKSYVPPPSLKIPEISAMSLEPKQVAPKFAGRPDQPVGTIEAPKNMAPPLPPGPVRLAPPILGGADVEQELGTITLQLVKQTLRFDGPEGALQYLQKSCGVNDRAKAERIVEEILRSNPELPSR